MEVPPDLQADQDGPHPKALMLQVTLEGYSATPNPLQWAVHWGLCQREAQ